MAKLSDIAEQEHGQSVIIYGAPKTGKTALAATLVEAGYTLHWFDFENGSQTLITSVPKELQCNINLYKVTDTKDKPIGIRTALEVLRMKPVKICTAHGGANCSDCRVLESKDAAAKKLNPALVTPERFETVDASQFGIKDVLVFDSLTQLSDSAMAVATAGLEDYTKLEFKHYDHQGFSLSMLLTGIQQAKNFHRVIISHEVDVSPADSKIEKLVPVGGTKNFSRKVPKYFDHVIYARIYNNRHQFASSTSFKPTITTGSRSDLAMESGEVLLSELLQAKPKAGGQSADLERDETGEVKGVPVAAKTNPFAKKK